LHFLTGKALGTPVEQSPGFAEPATIEQSGHTSGSEVPERSRATVGDGGAGVSVTRFRRPDFGSSAKARIPHFNPLPTNNAPNARYRREKRIELSATEIQAVLPRKT
jgi:hypothetical protein